MILAGDIGGTKTILSLIDKAPDGELHCVLEQTFASNEFQHFDDMLAQFMPHGTTIHEATLGIAGPVVNQRCLTTNLPWTLDGDTLKSRLGIQNVRLLNDLEAMAIGMLHLDKSEFIELNPDAEPQTGNIAVIAAGTGLGEAILYWDGKQHRPIATEGGHCSFAPQNLQQEQLLGYLRNRFSGHVSCERILSGIGFSHLYDFLLETEFAPVNIPIPNGNDNAIDRNATISNLGLSGSDALCVEAVRLFVEIYGGEAGNLALKSFATGGVYIGGGIAPKISSAMKSGVFLQAFKDKGRFQGLLGKISVKLALNQRTVLLGAMHYCN